MDKILTEQDLYEDASNESLGPCPEHLMQYFGISREQLDSEVLSYLNTHWRRLVKTFEYMRLWCQLDAKVVIDAGPSQIYNKLLQNTFGRAKLIYLGKPFQAGLVDTDFFDIDLEKDIMPVASSSVDIIIALELIEHFYYDPMFFISEANRVLKKNGQLVLTTPNIASLTSLRGLLLHYPPYYYMNYVNDKPLYISHRREFTVRDIYEFARSGGFSANVLTFNSYINKDDQTCSNLEYALKCIGLSAKDRGDTIFAVLTKTHNGVIDRYPDWFYKL